MSVKARAYLQVLGPILILGLVLIPHLGLRHYVYDDSYIHIRIAGHLLQYGQPYFNIGERLNASSSPAWTIVVAGVLSATHSQLGGLVILGAVVSTLGVFAFVALLGSEAALTMLDRIAVGAVYLAMTLPSSTRWMETPLALLVMSTSLLLYRRDRDVAFVLLGLAPFIRPELAVFCAVIWIHAVSRKKAGLSRLVGYSLIGAVPFLVYQLCFFGTLLPNAVAAKSIVYSLTPADTLHAIGRSLIPPSAHWPAISNLLPADQSWIWIAAIMPLAAYLLLRGTEKPSFLFMAFVLSGVVVMAAYVLGRTFMFQWYYPIYLVPLLAGLYLGLKASYPRFLKPVTILLAVPILGFWTLYLVQIGLSSFYPRLDSDFAANARARSYLEIGYDLRQRYPDARVMGSEIGALGYAFQGYMMDGVGLVTPAALKYHPLMVPSQRSNGQIGAIPNDFIQAVQPDIIVSMPIFLEEFNAKGEKSNYVLFKRPVFLPEDAGYTGRSLWGDTKIYVYIRRDILSPSLLPR